MKVNIEIDCTPPRGPAVHGPSGRPPMQTAVMEKLQQQVTSNIEKISAESLLQSWFTFDPEIAERFSGHVRDHGMALAARPRRDKAVAAWTPTNQRESNGFVHRACS
jgi:hypothetical protein